MPRRPTPIVIPGTQNNNLAQGLQGITSIFQAIKNKRDQAQQRQAAEELGITPTQQKALGVEGVKNLVLTTLASDLERKERERNIDQATNLIQTLGGVQEQRTLVSATPEKSDIVPAIDEPRARALAGLTSLGVIPPTQLAGQLGIGKTEPAKFSDIGITETISTELLSDPDIQTAGTFSQRPVEFRARKVREAQERISKRKITEAERRGIAGIQAQIDAQSDRQIEISQLINVRDPETFAQFPIGTTHKQAAKLNAILATPKQVGEIFDLDKSEFILDEIDALTADLIVAQTPEEALLQGGGLTIEAAIKTNPIAATYIDSKQAFLGNLARTMGGERGVLTDRDILRIDKILPSFRDTKQIRDLKILGLKGMLGQAKATATAKILGKKANEEFEDIKKKILSALESGDATEIQSALQGIGGRGSVTKVRRFNAQGIEQ